ncbi:MAG: hypothetical protein GY944_04545 [bacterium]|nr:hypothetical protein [bacterium]
MSERSIKIRVSIMDMVMEGKCSGPDAMRAEKLLRAADTHDRKIDRMAAKITTEREAAGQAREQAATILNGVCDESGTESPQPTATEPGAEGE